MYKCSEAFLKAISNYKRELKARVTIGNIVITDDILKLDLEESANAAEEFTLGGAVASTFNLEINNLHGLYDNNKFDGLEAKVEIGALIGKQIEYISMGYFTIDEVLKDRKSIKIEGSDLILQLVNDYVPAITFPSSVDTILADISKQANLQYVPTGKSITLQKPEANTLRETLRDLAAVYGGFARINKDKKLEIKTITETDIVISRENYYSLDIKEPVIIDKYTVTESVFPGIGVIDGFDLEYYPFTSAWQGNPALEIGDKILLNDNGKIYSTVILNQKYEFLGGLKVTSEASGISQTSRSTKFIGNVKKTLGKFKSEIEQLTDKIKLLVSSDIFNAYVEVTDKKVELAAEEIGKAKADFKVETDKISSNVTDLEKKTNTKIEQTSNSIKEEVTDKLKNMSLEVDKTAKGLELTVKKDNVIGQINMSAEQLLIDIAKVNLSKAVLSWENLSAETKQTIVGLAGKDGANGTNGRDGRDGADSYIPSWVKFTEISKDFVRSGLLQGNRIYTSSSENAWIELNGSWIYFYYENNLIFKLGTTGTNGKPQLFFSNGCSIDTFEGDLRLRTSDTNYLRINNEGGMDFVHNGNTAVLVDSTGNHIGGGGNNYVFG